LKVLLLTQIVPFPPESGPRVKTYHVLRFLAERGHRVTLASFTRAQEQPYVDALRPWCEAVYAVPLRRSRPADAWSYARSLREGAPFLVVRDDLPAMRNLVARLTREQAFDIIHADQLTMGQFALGARGPRRVFDAHNAVWTIVARAARTAPLVVRPLLAREARLVKRHEGALCRAMDAVLAVSEADRQKLLEAGARADNITVVPIAVDTRTLRRMANGPDTLNIVTLGTLYYPPNADGVRWFMREVFPRVRSLAPAATMTIIGPRPPRDIQGMANPPSVSVTGYVADLGPYLEQATLMVVPVRVGSGMRVRILEALARGIPVVTTTTGAEGIDVRNDEHLLIADEPEAFAAAVVRLLNDPITRRRLAAAGRRLVEQKYDWQVTLPGVEAAYQRALQRQPA
jgi:polysaccharide biosynthesis protein PslH